MIRFLFIHACMSICYFISISNTKAQNISLNVIVNDSINKNSFINTLSFKKIHNSTESISEEIQLIVENLKYIGYFTNTIDSVTTANNKTNLYLTLNKKINHAILSASQKTIKSNKNLNLNRKITLKIEDLKGYLLKINNFLDEEGKPFSELCLKNIRIKNDTLFTNLKITNSKQRTINKIIVKGYENFPDSYIKHYLKIKNKTKINHNFLRKTSNSLKQLDFITETKTPETLFTNDSTIVYIYLKKKKTSAFDGLINFNSSGTNNLIFNGHLNLELNNILNTGEKFLIDWKANGNERQSFKLLTCFPYIFNSPFISEIQFNVYKQDSTFLNTKFNFNLFYDFTSNTKVGITYNTESSFVNINKTNNSNFSNYFIGSYISYFIPYNDSFYNKKLLLKFNPEFGTRNLENLKDFQIKLKFESSYLHKFSKRHQFYIRNETAALFSNNILINESFRIGGIKNIRGYVEESLSTHKYSLLNTEYRYINNQNSYLYTIFDYGVIKTQRNKNKNLISLGLGYYQKIKNSNIVINLTNSYNQDDSKFTYLNINIGLKSYF
ncbi:hypothetical protein [Tenacibaculum sp. IB213877]|uniref:hypothetical protein n=1 Tax=Tenacibaculum sp. IB213877 TaxID=3097351 RepID=UPI002A5A5079|nr:hypothetical protein [Tenacibaculum sp. IB213877]MDY0780079.1 hypothetical protein [Tenacibaculum sp. IB213877]